MKSIFVHSGVTGKEDGAVLVFVSLSILLMVVGLTSFAIDSHHMTMVRNELQISADAGSLAGAGVLINQADGTINTGANAEAEAVARVNPAAGADRAAGSIALDKLDVITKRGHWSFTTETFTENNATTQLTGWESMSAAALDVNTNFINAVQVETRRDNTRTIFTNIFGWKDQQIRADAVAYIGFASSVPPNTVDIPFAVCKQFITVDNHLSCGVARAQNEGVETGGWTNLSQDREGETCTSSNAATVNSGILAGIPPAPCEDVNDKSLTYGKGIGTINGNVTSSYSIILEHCFVDVTHPDNADHEFQNDSHYKATKPWLEVTLPVVDCVTGDYGGGSLACDDNDLPFAGIVTVDIIWMSSGKNNVPVEYTYNGTSWNCSDPTDNALCWSEFQNAFGFSFPDPDGDGLPEDNGLYFAPGCEYTEPAGGVGGDNFGIQSKVPVLVE